MQIGKLICDNEIFTQKTKIYIECEDNKLVFSHIPVCFSGKIESNKTLCITLSIPKYVDILCNLIELDIGEEITIELFDKITNETILDEPLIINLELVNDFMLSATGKIIIPPNICSCNFYVIIKGILKNSLSSLCYTSYKACSNACVCLTIKYE